MDSDMQDPDGLAARKSAARMSAFSRRKLAFQAGDPSGAVARLLAVLKPHLGRPIAGYMPMRTELDPLPAMTELAQHGPVGVPVIEGAGLPLQFHLWTPDAPMRDGPFGARVPLSGHVMQPEVVIVPLVAFDRAGGRLGYGGGFYDRTLERLRANGPERLRANGPVFAVGYAWAAQEDVALPLEHTDQPLDAIVTEVEVLRFNKPGPNIG